MPDCHEVDVPSPRIGCSCRECYYARERSLDPRLISLAREHHIGVIPTFSPAHETVYRGLQGYLAGRIEWGSLYIEIIDALVKQSDDAHGRLLKMSSMQAPSCFISNT